MPPRALGRVTTAHFGDRFSLYLEYLGTKRLPIANIAAGDCRAKQNGSAPRVVTTIVGIPGVIPRLTLPSTAALLVTWVHLGAPPVMSVPIQRAPVHLDTSI
jgi:hypothetical protein